MSVRKAHNSGRNHERNVLDYYQSPPFPFFSSKQYLPPMSFSACVPKYSDAFSEFSVLEIGHEKAQSVIDSITSSYAAEGQPGANPMLAPQGGAGPMGGQPFPPPPFGFPGMCPKDRVSRREISHQPNRSPLITRYFSCLQCN